MQSLVPATYEVIARATSAESDEELLLSWLDGFNSQHTRDNFEVTARRFLAALAPVGLRQATVEQVRRAISDMASAGRKAPAAATVRQYTLRVKSLLAYAKELGYCQFNAGATIKVKAGAFGDSIAKRLLEEREVARLIKAARSRRDRVLLQTLYAGGIRISELVRLNWGDVIERTVIVNAIEARCLQLDVHGKGGKRRQVLLNPILTDPVLALRGEAGEDDPVFAVANGGRMDARSVRRMVERTARRAGIDKRVSPHLLRHAHGSHALDRNVPLTQIQAMLGHANISTTGGYLHAKPRTSSSIGLDASVILGEE